jgi:lipopolysaccharide/colanic/teichoic acid biosynthesis glycosyltransferase
MTLPLWVIIGISIKLTSRGPVFYSQSRVGLDKRRSGMRADDPRRRLDVGGRPFRIYKFRTMYLGAEEGTGPIWAAEGDERITPIGRFLRQYRLDELPQLLNVLNGEMNVVGPRPERPSIFAKLRERIPNYHLRQRIAPGITGHAQINQKYDSSLEDVTSKVEFDLQYIDQASTWEDLKIMLKTIPVMLFRRGGR